MLCLSNPYLMFISCKQILLNLHLDTIVYARMQTTKNRIKNTHVKREALYIVCNPSPLPCGLPCVRSTYVTNIVVCVILSHPRTRSLPESTFLERLSVVARELHGKLFRCAGVTGQPFPRPSTKTEQRYRIYH